jgi:transcriptional regulator with XRE-family HTH domain
VKHAQAVETVADGAAEREGRLDELGLLLAYARTTRGWTQRHLAIRLDMDVERLRLYEATGYAAASLTTLIRVAQALGLHVSAQFEMVEAPASRAERAGARRAAVHVFKAAARRSHRSGRTA